ncbi:hypothetical protein BDZ89DRAFT_540181 [Hymenopellis radicata]|nr:hypothetical protein BDZ89DRAFT_540181 [Hymenopellis radicata]
MILGAPCKMLGKVKLAHFRPGHCSLLSRSFIVRVSTRRHATLYAQLLTGSALRLDPQVYFAKLSHADIQIRPRQCALFSDSLSTICSSPQASIYPTLKTFRLKTNHCRSAFLLLPLRRLKPGNALTISSTSPLLSTKDLLPRDAACTTLLANLLISRAYKHLKPKHQSQSLNSPAHRRRQDKSDA